MDSLEIDSLFTDIPPAEIIEIYANKPFKNKIVHGLK